MKRIAARCDPARRHAVTRRGRVVAAIATTSAAFVLAACVAIAPRPLAPRVEVTGLQRVTLDGRALMADVVLKVTNPNAFPIAVDALEAELLVEKARIATGRLPAPTTLPPQQDARVAIEVRSEFADVAGLAERVLRRGRLAYEISGFLMVHDGHRLEFTRQGEFTAADLLGRRR